MRHQYQNKVVEDKLVSVVQFSFWMTFSNIRVSKTEIVNEE